MEVSMSFNSLLHLPLSTSRLHLNDDASLLRHSLFSTPYNNHHHARTTRRHSMLVVEAKGKKGMIARQYQRTPPPPLPKIEDDGNPKFVIFIRMANVYLWYPLSVVTGGTTAKIMVAAKDNFLGKYIYKDTLAKNLAAVIYQDEKAIQKTAFKQYRVLRSATNYRYGYKLVENGNIRSALSTTDVIELPTEDQLKTVLDKVKDFFGDAKESFGKITALGSTAIDDESEKDTKQKSKIEG
ncbi:unnamed protein product [Lupinus luteus]|uniref:Protein HHL1, chloroplastic n=1 Tax=Lupinus luteus TaxID=3873 RepID=A0AAV1XGV3_LUPLU